MPCAWPLGAVFRGPASPPGREMALLGVHAAGHRHELGLGKDLGAEGSPFPGRNPSRVGVPTLADTREQYGAKGTSGSPGLTLCMEREAGCPAK